MKETLYRISKLYWADRLANKDYLSNCIRRLKENKINPDKKTCKEIVIRGKFDYYLSTSIYGCYWIFSCPLNAPLLIPGARVYRVSLTTNKWGFYENTSNHSLKITNEKEAKFGVLSHEDLEPIPIKEVPSEVLYLAMLQNLSEKL